MALIRSILFALLFYPWTAVMVLLSFAASLIGTPAVRACAHGWAHGHRLLCAIFLGISSRVEGTPPSGCLIIASKHQSMFETIELLLLLEEPAIVLKRELADVPFWGWVVRRYGVIPVDRDGGGASLRRMMRAAQTAKAEGRPILIFPEGTRVAPGTRPALQSGFAGLYRTLRLPVAPIALNSGLVSPRRSFIKRPGIITFRFGPQIPAGLDRDEIEAAVHEAINVLEPEI